MDAIIALLKEALGDEAVANAVLEKAKTDGLDSAAAAQKAAEADWIGWGVPKLKARLIVEKLVPAPVAAKPAFAGSIQPTSSLLPQVPTDESFLANLVQGGVLKMSETDVIAAVRAVNAERFGLFNIDDRILKAIEDRAEEMEEPLPEIFYAVQKALKRKAHADVLAALDVPGTFVTEARKKQFLGRVSGIMGELAGFYSMVDGYVQNWQTQMGPQAMLSIVGVLAGGAGAAGMPVMNEAPDATPLADQARGIIDRLNKMFAGSGIPVARALAADAQQLSELIKKPELIAAVGASNREEMLKKLGIGVGADVARTEKSVLQFALCVLKVNAVEPSQLPPYILAVRQVGAVIPWATLSGANGAVRTPSGRGRGEPFGDEGTGRKQY